MGDSATRVVIAHREPSFILQAGLRTHERDILPDLRLPVRQLPSQSRSTVHSGVEQILDSFTVAGAVPEWFLRTHRLPVSPLGKKPAGNLK